MGSIYTFFRSKENIKKYYRKGKVHFTFYEYVYTACMAETKIKNKLPELRARHRMTQDALASAVDVTRQTIISIEKETYTPSLPLAMKLALYFELPVEEIFYIA